MAKIFDADTDAWYEPGQLPALPRKPRPLELDPALGMLPGLPFYQQPNPEEQGSARGMPPLPQVPKMQLGAPGMGPTQRYQAPQLDLMAPPGFGAMGATTASPMAAAAALQGQPAPASGGDDSESWTLGSGRTFSLGPEERARLRDGYAHMRDRMGKSLDPLAGLQEDASGSAAGLMKALSEFMDPEQAAQLALQVHSGELNRDSAEGRNLATIEARKAKGSGGGAPGAPGFNLKEGSAASQAQQRIISSANTTFSAPKAREAQSKVRMAMRAINLDSGLGDETAFRGLVNSLHGAASSNRELQGMQDTAGKIDQWVEQAKGVFLSTRRLPPALMQQLRAVLDENDRMLQSKIESAVSFVRERAKNDPILAGLGRAESDAKWMGDAYASGALDNAGGAPAEDPDKELQELLR
jgi:hypothetical protein